MGGIPLEWSQSTIEASLEENGKSHRASAYQKKI
jgi:hypothetical protein